MSSSSSRSPSTQSLLGSLFAEVGAVEKDADLREAVRCVLGGLLIALRLPQRTRLPIVSAMGLSVSGMASVSKDLEDRKDWIGKIMGKGEKPKETEG